MPDAFAAGGLVYFFKRKAGFSPISMKVSWAKAESVEKNTDIDDINTQPKKNTIFEPKLTVIHIEEHPETERNALKSQCWPHRRRQLNAQMIPCVKKHNLSGRKQANQMKDIGFCKHLRTTE